ncbi:MAG TPA: aminotransferase class I/II-fold pyridoxal phosphate-dependent enzyme [bacterium]|nr:aminotransferase class I/II-fold pyridoxal phosphate-dependent enzyme [bacterium]
MSDQPIALAPPLSRLIAALPPSTPFVAPEALERAHGIPLRLRLGANESAFGISPRAWTAMQEAIAAVGWYGDPESYALRAALAKNLGIGIDHLLIGNGIDGLLGYVVRALVDPGDTVVATRGTYPTFAYHVRAFGGRLVAVPYRDDRADLPALLDAARKESARLVYLANPDNPSGSWHHRAQIAEFIELQPEECLLLLDEAYHEFAAADAVPLPQAERPNLIRLRTFSKAHGMAGARIGYAIGPVELIVAIGRFRNQFEVSRIAQAGAVASLDDPGFVDGVIRAVEEGRRDYGDLAECLGVPVIPSATNFVCFDLGSHARARAALQALLARGVFIRMPGEAPLDRCVRVTVGTPAQRADFAEVFSQTLQEV